MDERRPGGRTPSGQHLLSPTRCRRAVTRGGLERAPRDHDQRACETEISVCSTRDGGASASWAERAESALPLRDRIDRPHRDQSLPDRLRVSTNPEETHYSTVYPLEDAGDKVRGTLSTSSSAEIFRSIYMLRRMRRRRPRSYSMTSPW